MQLIATLILGASALACASPGDNTPLPESPHYILSLKYYANKDCKTYPFFKPRRGDIPDESGKRFDNSTVCQEWPVFGALNNFKVDMVWEQKAMCRFESFALGNLECAGDVVEVIEVHSHSSACNRFKKGPGSVRVHCWGYVEPLIAAEKNGTGKDEGHKVVSTDGGD